MEFLFIEPVLGNSPFPNVINVHKRESTWDCGPGNDKEATFYSLLISTPLLRISSQDLLEAGPRDGPQ
jgi:hypothetical protein